LIGIRKKKSTIFSVFLIINNTKLNPITKIIFNRGIPSTRNRLLGGGVEVDDVDSVLSVVCDVDVGVFVVVIGRWTNIFSQLDGNISFRIEVRRHDSDWGRTFEIQNYKF
jgi:hypothetical protein